MTKTAEIEQACKLIARLPGLGKRSAQRVVLTLLTNRDSLLDPLMNSLELMSQSVQSCSNCGNLDSSDPCYICCSGTRDGKYLCVIERVADLWALERSGHFSGKYHILGGVLSALDGVGPEQLFLDRLIERAKEEEVEEVILALSATVDGQSTAHYIANELKGYCVKISSIAHGVPVGGELDYLDDGTLSAAFSRRDSLL